MGVLRAKARAASAVIKRPGRPPSEQSFPIPDRAHAIAARGRINQSDLTPAQKAAVRARIAVFLGRKKGK